MLLETTAADKGTAPSLAASTNREPPATLASEQP